MGYKGEPWEGARPRAGETAGWTVRRVGRLLGYGVLGFVWPAAIPILLNFLEPLQAVVYDLFYPSVGPSKATITAILANLLVPGAIAISVPLPGGYYL